MKAILVKWLVLPLVVVCSAGFATPVAQPNDTRAYGGSAWPWVEANLAASAANGSRADAETVTHRNVMANATVIAAVAACAALAALLGLVLLSRHRKRPCRTADATGEPGSEDVPSIESREENGIARSAGRAALPAGPDCARDQCRRCDENDELLREFVSYLAHDLRTPLAALEGYLETLATKSDISRGEQRKYVDSAKKLAARLRLLITEMHELSRLEVPGLRLNPERFSLAELVQDTAMELRWDAGQKNIDLALEVGETAAYATTDIGLIQRVLENLIGNAIRFSPPGGKVSVTIEERGESLLISIVDDGQGIPEEQLPRIFQRFYSRSIDQGAQGESCGLGLAIVKKILDMHGSPIVVSSEVGVGTRFEFELPLDREAG